MHAVNYNFDLFVAILLFLFCSYPVPLSSVPFLWATLVSDDPEFLTPTSTSENTDAHFDDNLKSPPLFRQIPLRPLRRRLDGRRCRYSLPNLGESGPCSGHLPVCHVPRPALMAAVKLSSVEWDRSAVTYRRPPAIWQRERPTSTHPTTTNSSNGFKNLERKVSRFCGSQDGHHSQNPTRYHRRDSG